MSKFTKKSCIAVLLIWMFVFASVHEILATEILDQFFSPPGTASFTIPVSNQFASFVDGGQTFTVGLSGILSHVEITLGFNTTRNGLILDLRPTIGGVPLDSDASAFASVFIPSSSIPTGFPDFVNVDFSPFNIPVTPGEQLALVLRGAIRGVDDGQVNWRGDKGDPYLLGAAFFRTNVAPWSQACGFGACDIPGERADLGFKTFVAPIVVPIPEPNAVILFVTGVTIMIIRRSSKG
jgi:hypothetical protein